MNFKECEINGCQCWDCGQYRVIKQKAAKVYNAYKANKSKPGKSVSSYSSVVKKVIRVDKYKDEETGKEKEVEVLGPEQYSTLEEAIAVCNTAA